jgi:hypothetical protein
MCLSLKIENIITINTYVEKERQTCCSLGRKTGYLFIVHKKTEDFLFELKNTNV